MPFLIKTQKQFKDEIINALNNTKGYWINIRDNKKKGFNCSICDLAFSYMDWMACDWCNENIPEVFDICREILFNEKISRKEKIDIIINKLDKIIKKYNGSV